VGGELQLTDAINLLAQEQAVYAFVFEGGRFDVGNKLDYLKATIELAIGRDDIGKDFRDWLTEFVERKKLI
jgi:UTP--glucose-1-phosphate uridylyltransferase